MSDFPLVLALDVAGNPFKWITFEDFCYYKTKNLISWSLGEDAYLLHGGIQRVTGMQSTLSVDSIVAIKGVSISKMKSYNVPPLTNPALFRRDHNLCAYCGHTYSSSVLSRDHIMPRSKGGPDIWTNVVTACSPCNRYKDDRTPEEASMELLYLPFEPNRSHYLILQNKKILACQMEFLLAKANHTGRIKNNVIQ